MPSQAGSPGPSSVSDRQVCRIAFTHTYQEPRAAALQPSSDPVWPAHTVHTSTSCNYALALILAPPSIISATARSCGGSSPRARCLHSLLGFPRILSRIGPLYSPGGTRVPFCKISMYPSRASASAAARASGMSSRQAAMPKLRGASEGQQDLSGPRAVQRSRMAERSLSCIAASSIVDSVKVSVFIHSASMRGLRRALCSRPLS